MMGKYAKKKKKDRNTVLRICLTFELNLTVLLYLKHILGFIFPLLSIFSTKSPPILYKRRGKDVTSQTMADGQA